LPLSCESSVSRSRRSQKKRMVFSSILLRVSFVRRRRKKKLNLETKQGSSFVVCPVCFGSVPRALVDAHVAGCLALQRQAQMEATAGGGGGRGTAEEQKQQQRRPPQPLPAAAVAETATTTALATTTKAAAPAGEQQQALRSLSQVLRPQPRAGSAKASAAAASAPQKRQAAAAAAAPPPLSRRAPTPQPPPAAATAAAAAGGASAFAELMRAQRSASTTHVFSLGEIFSLFLLFLDLFFHSLRSLLLLSLLPLLAPHNLLPLLTKNDIDDDIQSSEGTASSGTGAR
jgi:hypothetical protein